MSDIETNDLESADYTPPESPIPLPEEPIFADALQRVTYRRVQESIIRNQGVLGRVAKELGLETPTIYSMLLPGRVYNPLRGFAKALRIHHTGRETGRVPAYKPLDRATVLAAWEATEYNPRQTAKRLGIPYSTTLDLLNRIDAPQPPAAPRFRKDGSKRPLATAAKKGGRS